MKAKLKIILELMRGNIKLYLLAIFAVICSTVLMFIPPLILRGTIDSVIGNVPVDAHSVTGKIFAFFGGTDFLAQNLWMPGLILLGLTIISGIFTFYTGKWTAMASESIARHIRDRLYDHLQRLPFSYHSKAETGDLIQRCSSDVETVRRFLSIQIIEVGKALLMVSIALPIMIKLNKSMTLVSMIAIPFLFGFSYVFFNKIKSSFKASDEAEGRLSNVLQENLSGVRVVRAFGRQNYEINKFDIKNTEYRDITFKLLKDLALYWSSTDFISMCQIAAVLAFGVYKASLGAISIGTLVLFFTYEGQLLWPIRQMGRILTDMGKATVSFKRIYEILEVKQESYKEDPSFEPEILGNIEFQDVKFSYDDKNMILDGVNLKIEAGQTVAILGHTGAGKSTLVNLIPRLIDYQSGSIKIDGHELKSINKNWIRQKVSLLLQEPFLYSKTIKDNIKIGNKYSSKDDIFEATKIASVHDVINEFDRGYETLVGEKGVTLSGGQKQRVSIARTILRNSPILIFDDSLSAVDTETDAKIRKAMQNRKGLATTVIISHRITTLSEADKIFVLDNGKIVQEGNHKELIKQEGLYKRIWDIQNSLDEELTDYKIS